MLVEMKTDMVCDYTDPNIYIMQLVDVGKKRNTYEFVPICDYGTPKQIKDKLSSGGIKVFKEVEQ